VGKRVAGNPLAMQSASRHKDIIIKKGCYDPARNERIYQKWFARGPRMRMQTLLKRFALSEKRVVDVGCGYGNNLWYFGPGSYGIEVLEKEVAFAQSIGLDARVVDIAHEAVTNLPKAEVALCYAVIEHVENPHVVLRKLHALLEPGGLVLIYVPTIPVFPILGRLPRIGGAFSGYTNVDHINAFTPATIRFMAERAGFHTQTLTTAMPWLGALCDLPGIRALFDGIVYVGTAIEDFEYHPHSTRKVAANAKGFVYKEW
jgi:SAM-dependent methyltransferase